MVTSKAEYIKVDPENRNYMHYLHSCHLCERRRIYIGDIVHDPLFGRVHDPLYLGLSVNCHHFYKNRKYYQFIKAVNGVSHSPKTANTFLIRSRPTDFKLEWKWVYEALLQCSISLFIRHSIVARCEHWWLSVTETGFYRHSNWNWMWRYLNIHQNPRSTVSGIQDNCMVIGVWGYGLAYSNYVLLVMS